jgi:putative phosphoribosyl transferase
MKTQRVSHHKEPEPPAALLVAPASGCSAVRMEADEVISVAEPERFLAILQWYENFSQVSDEDVDRLLEKGAGSLPSAA